MTLLDGIRTTLEDGTPVLIRLLRHSDAPLIEEVVANLSPQSRNFRFLREIERLDAKTLDLFARPDHTGHEAVIGLVLSGDTARPAGISRGFRIPSRPDRAELGMSIVDALHGKGLGGLLLGALAARMSHRGVRYFDAMVHPRNGAMIHLMEGLGAERHRDEDGLMFTLELHRNPAHYAASRGGDAIRRAYDLTD